MVPILHSVLSNKTFLTEIPQFKIISPLFSQYLQLGGNVVN